MRTARIACTGVTLVELMVGMAIGLVMLLVTSTVYVNSRAGFRTVGENAAQEEAGHYALNLLARNIRTAGFSMLRTDAAYPVSGIDRYLAGCDLAYADTSTSDYRCATSTASGRLPSAALEVRYETDAADNSTAQGQDCIGNNAIATATPAGSATHLVVNRFFVTRDARSVDGMAHDVGQLSCSTLNTVTGAVTASQPLLQGIEQIAFRYLVSASGDAESAAVARTASDLNATDTWGQVNAVEVCVLSRSIGKGIATDGRTYQDCQGRPINASGRETYRTYTAMVGVRTNYRSSPLVAP